MPEFKLGFKEYAEQHPEIGACLSAEVYITPEWSMQMADEGILHYRKLNNTVRFEPLPKG